MSLFQNPPDAAGSLVWGTIPEGGAVRHLLSPVDQTLLQKFRLLTEAELQAAVAQSQAVCPMDPDEVGDFARRLALIIKESYPVFLEATRKETGFNLADSRELVEGAMDYAWRFPCEVHDAHSRDQESLSYSVGSIQRNIQIQPCAWGTVALILPQNAFLLLAVTGMLNALAAGNRVILRPPLQSANSAVLLIAALERARPPQNAVSVLFTTGRDFMAALHHAPVSCLIHFMGSSQHASDILTDSFRHGKTALIDGEGNGWAWVDRTVDVKVAADVLTAGALRFNGQTCTSINGAIIHPGIYPQVRRALVERWTSLTFGNTLDEEIRIGPLFDVKQAEWCQERLAHSGADILCGNSREGNLLTPTLAENPSNESALVREGLFGPALWIAPGDRNAFVARWSANRFPLSATVLSETPDAAWWLNRLPNLARVTINGDPSEEYLFAPWGGYASSGTNRVSSWLQKYQRPVQIDVNVT